MAGAGGSALALAVVALLMPTDAAPT